MTPNEEIPTETQNSIEEIAEADGAEVTTEADEQKARKRDKRIQRAKKRLFKSKPVLPSGVMRTHFHGCSPCQRPRKVLSRH